MEKIILMALFLSFSLTFADNSNQNSDGTFYTVLKEVKEIINYVSTDTSITVKEKAKFWSLIQKKIELMEELLDERLANNNASLSISVPCIQCKDLPNPKCPVCGGDGYTWSGDEKGIKKPANNNNNYPAVSVPCAKCKASPDPKCKACNGDGYAWSDDESGNQVNCRTCKGSGFFGGTNCQGCSGSGWANSHPNKP